MITKLPGVREEPEVVVAPWVVLEVAGTVVAGTPPPYRFVVAYDRANSCGRVSTLIVEQDFEKKCARTKSGRLYRLEGPPALDADAWYVWKRNAGRVQIKDVSGDFWPGYEAWSALVVETQKAMLESELKALGYKVVGWVEDEDQPS